MAQKTQHNPQTAQQSKKVLLAWERSLALDAYESALTAAGYEVVAARHGPDAEAQLDAHTFTAVLVGPAFAAANRPTSQRLAGLSAMTPVILVHEAAAAPGAAGPAYAYLNAPSTPTDVMDALGTVLWPHSPRHEQSAVLPSTAAIRDVAYGLQEEFDLALASLFMAYQPIVDCAHNELFGYEALVRCNPGNLSSPPALLAAAESLGRLQDLSRQIRAQVAANLLAAPQELVATRIFVNLHARDLLDPALFDADAPLSAHAHRIVLEITERTPLEEVPDVLSRIGRLRALGYRIALDDLGAGYSGLSTFAQLEPEVVKLDMALVRQVEKSRTKRHIIASMVQLCEKLNIHVVAEGIETIAERDVLRALGCQLLQGYYFGRPQRGFGTPTY